MEKFVIVLWITFGVTCFILGYLYSEWRHNRRNTKKEKRREQIISGIARRQRERYLWRIRHPERIQYKAIKGQRIFKGGADRMTVDEFNTAFRNTIAMRMV